MKKVYLCIALCVMLLAALSINAQRNMFVRGDNGSVNAVEVSNVDYATIHPSNSWFKINNDGVTDTKFTYFTGSCTFGLVDGSEAKSLSDTPEMGVCYSSDNKIPTVADNCQTLGTELKTYSFTLESLTEGTAYYFRPYIKLANTIFYGDVAEAETLVDRSCDINGHKFIDLGLPSGALWAEASIGAETATDDGYYFAWGETTTKETYLWDNYRWGTEDNRIKYYEGDGKTVLDRDDDAAYAIWGDPCRMPTEEEFEELTNTNNCTWFRTTKTTSSGTTVDGWECESVKNGNSIFFPLSGWYKGDQHISSDEQARYWCTKADVALCFDIVPLPMKWSHRYTGLPIRPVAKLE